MPALAFFLACGVTGIGGACHRDGCHRVHNDPTASSTSVDHSLHVVRVCTEFDSRAGTPIRTDGVLSILRTEELGTLGIVVNGHPAACWGDSSNGAPFAQHGDVPALRYFGTSANLQTNRLESDQIDHPGDEGWIAGFRYEETEQPNQRRWRRIGVRVRIVDRASDGVLRLLAPPGDYGGVIGGPLGIRDSSGHWCVLGVVVSVLGADDNGVELLARRIPARLCTPAQ